jgi:RimJ/RimL family protein N-acetyltransferase
MALVPQPDDGVVQLSKLYLLEKCRGQGLGKEMLTFAEQRCRELGAGTLWLTVNKYNAGPIAFYKRMGFENVGAIVTDIGGGFVMDDYRMQKILTPSRKGRKEINYELNELNEYD